MLRLEIFWRSKEVRNSECSSCDYIAMNHIIVADIFGKTPALIALANTINADVIVDPYSGEHMNFKNEAQAYNYFTENIGLDKYLETLLKTVKECSGECILVGFSIGASVIWQLSQLASKKITNKVIYATCFYGAQIRHLTELSPKFDVKLIFPKKEPHFDVSALQQVLARKLNVTAIQVDFLHGFMNTHSNNFSHVAYEKYLGLLRRDLSLKI